MSTTYGDLIKQERKAHGYTQKALAEHACISRTYLADIERNRYNPSMTTLQRIAQALNVSVHALLPHESAPTVPSSAKQAMYELIDTLSDEQTAQLLELAKAALFR